ncbi:DUF4288 domain-containing protein [Bacillus sp. AFS053548]|uniref:DUF4288 domain-containing protein n=1 Tax=Bacillus sp. AFS053548 TaxID=2033505 RepID=UPI000BFBC3DD|nr:DUF4288 domain-containing protein [Bacillus sp. AFS053548]PGM53855.1 S-ribosylhomocysteinase [Bacillus sp. AFS053548]
MKKRLRKKLSNEWEWYAVKVLYESIHSGNPSPEKIDEDYYDKFKMYEESIVLFKARSLDHANSIAERNAIKSEHSYKNMYDEVVNWKFVEIIDCYNLIDDKIRPGTEIYSRFLKVPTGIPTKKIISHYYPETIEDEVVDQNLKSD